MIQLTRTDSKSKDFQELVAKLDKELAVMDGDLHDFYHQYNGIEDIKHAVVLYNDNIAVACGALKKFDEHSAEIKRMYVLESERGKGYASAILRELETWAKTLGYTACILETGNAQNDAVNLYKHKNYTITENYGQYIGVANSICFKKTL